MAALVWGDGSGAFLTTLSTALRERTRRRAEELDKAPHDHYTPWLCIRPVLDGPIDPELAEASYASGGLLTEQSELRRIDRFLRGQGSAVVDNMPVPYDEWPVMDDVKSARPDAVAAFFEGRALLARSTFLDDLYASLVDVVIPQRRERASGFDTALARGAVFRTFPQGRTGLLAGFQLAHAMGHQAAMLVQSVDPIFATGRFGFIDYEVRRDQRSADHAFVSAVALGYMVILSHAIYGREADPVIADEHIAGYGESLTDALLKATRSIRSSTKPTDVGAAVLDELESLL